MYLQFQKLYLLLILHLVHQHLLVLDYLGFPLLPLLLVVLVNLKVLLVL